VKRSSKRAVASAVSQVKVFEPPPAVAVVVNGEPLPWHEVVARVLARLQTGVVRDEVEQRETRTTEVVLMRPRPGERPSLFEMGLPVCEVDMPWHVDLQGESRFRTTAQQCPLRGWGASRRRTWNEWRTG
jgi:hypothetical protein